MIMGFYAGIGDFLSAVPIINILLKNGNDVTIIVTKPILELAEIVKFEKGKLSFIYFSLFSKDKLASLGKLTSSLTSLRPDYFFVSPHAQRKLSSWKLPILLFFLKSTVWRRCCIVGSKEERLSFLFTKSFPVPKNVNLLERERRLHVLSGSIKEGVDLDHNIFLIEAEKNIYEYDLIIHPGASKKLRKWPPDYYHRLVNLLNNNLCIAFTGVDDDIAEIKNYINDFDNIVFITESMKSSIIAMSKSKIAITMDSGFSHVAAFLGIRHFALFGSADPKITPPVSSNSEIVFTKALSCQPCNSHSCIYAENYCMKLIKPELIAKKVQAALSKFKEPYSLENDRDEQ